MIEDLKASSGEVNWLILLRRSGFLLGGYVLLESGGESPFSFLIVLMFVVFGFSDPGESKKIDEIIKILQELDRERMANKEIQQSNSSTT